jgi:hypothetical protein
MGPSPRAIAASALVSASLIAAASACGGAERAIDLRHVNWLEVSLPGSICGADRPIHLKDGAAIVRSGRWRQWPRVHVTDTWVEKPVVYGMLSGHPSAAVSVNCNNGGGTVDGVLAYAQAIFTAAPTGPRLVGVVLARVRRPHQLATVVQVAFRGSDVVSREYYYGSADGSCCPSGRATTIWTYSHGTLSPAHTVITKRPYRFP